MDAKAQTPTVVLCVCSGGVDHLGIRDAPACMVSLSMNDYFSPVLLSWGYPHGGLFS